MGSRWKGRESYWRGVLEQQAQSGLSVANFCRQESISAPSFYIWRKKLAAWDTAGGGTQEANSGARQASSTDRAIARLLPVHIESLESPTPVRILLPQGVSIDAPSNIPQSELAELLRALGEARLC